MRRVSLETICRHCDRWLRTSSIGDYDGAVNGLQVANAGSVTRIAAAVDASLSTIRAAVERRADLLLVHHGLFWSARQPWTGPCYEVIEALITGRLAVYSSHLPLDLHPRLGNNVLLCRALGFARLRPFFQSHGQSIGWQCRAAVRREELGRRLHNVLRVEPTVIPAGPLICQRIGVVTGGAGSELQAAAAEGIDTFVTGEGPHWTYALAEDLKINVFYGGHYATETFGVKALAEHLSRRFQLPWQFIDHPTGL